MHKPWRESLPGIRRVDVFHPAAGHTCCYLLADKNEGALIDCGAKNGIGAIIESVADAGLQNEDIRWIIATHAHLDHAGAAGELMRRFPRATLGGHPSAVKHLTNPDARLLPAVRSLYGEKFYAEQYGDIPAVPESRARAFADDEKISFAGRELTILYTPGHAWHHISIYDESGGVFFAGDAYGVSFSDIKTGGDIFIPPVMPPTQFSPESAKQTLRRLRDLNASHAALSHFDVVRNAPSLAESQIAALEEWESAAQKIAASDEDFYKSFRAYLQKWYENAAGVSPEVISRFHDGDMRLTACGFAHLHGKFQPPS